MAVVHEVFVGLNNNNRTARQIKKMDRRNIMLGLDLKKVIRSFFRQGTDHCKLLDLDCDQVPMAQGHPELDCESSGHILHYKRLQVQ